MTTESRHAPATSRASSRRPTSVRSILTGTADPGGGPNALPRVDETAVPRPRRTGRGGRGERRADRASRLGGVDDVVELEQGRGVERLGVVVCGGGKRLNSRLALRRVVDRLQLAPEAEPHRPLEAHRAELG